MTFGPVIRRLAVAAFVFVLASALVPGAARAIDTIAREAILIEVVTGKVLFEKNAHASMPPASMSKLMTVFLVFERLRDGSLSLDDTFPVSANAWQQGGAKSGGSTMFLEPNSRVRVEDLLRGIIIQSGNDACIVVAEALGGSEEAFAREMTRRAREIGMHDSSFANSTGWPHPDHRTTAADLALLAQRIVSDFPTYMHYFSEKEFTYNGITQHNRNPLLYKEMGVDGMKTGHTENAGYGLTATALRDGRRLVLVVNGLGNKKERAQESERLIDWGFREFDNYALFRRDETVAEAEVWLGTDSLVPLVIRRDLTITMPRKARRDMKVSVVYDGPIPAPIEEGQKLATLSIEAEGEETLSLPLVAGTAVGQLGVFGRLGAALEYIVFGGS